MAADLRKGFRDLVFRYAQFDTCPLYQLGLMRPAPYLFMSLLPRHPPMVHRIGSHVKLVWQRLRLRRSEKGPAPQVHIDAFGADIEDHQA